MARSAGIQGIGPSVSRRRRWISSISSWLGTNFGRESVHFARRAARLEKEAPLVAPGKPSFPSCQQQVSAAFSRLESYLPRRYVLAIAEPSQRTCDIESPRLDGAQKTRRPGQGPNCQNPRIGAVRLVLAKMEFFHMPCSRNNFGREVGASKDRPGFGDISKFYRYVEIICNSPVQVKASRNSAVGKFWSSTGILPGGDIVNIGEKHGQASATAGISVSNYPKDAIVQTSSNRFAEVGLT
ncbi:hypothetical protein THAOC_24822 [Thalassiosira oceanica]|uniref:Uncharacterized protein n=1 Tax=Thalassiosira oceanica TaxID=159749 RepID=K0S357_THAOC|nr:hypothetical protein THAOC_24822 [Thalassiosira oceanica]|eukprot:EJK55446.1 hypothetical protein THAOC_24822 [Thalassiosira oceanica]